MSYALTQPIIFDEFIAAYPESANSHYELHDGVLIEMPKPRGKHSEIAGFVIAELNFEIRRLQLPNFIPRECIVKAINSQSGYEPDAIVLNYSAVASEPRWEEESIITQGESTLLVVEVVSTNWRDDYGRKVTDYEALGIPEYWIVDYLGLGATRYIGSPKQPTLSIYSLVDGEYQVKQFRDTQRLESEVFPKLNLSANQILSK